MSIQEHKTTALLNLLHLAFSYCILPFLELIHMGHVLSISKFSFPEKMLYNVINICDLISTIAQREDTTEDVPLAFRSLTVQIKH